MQQKASSLEAEIAERKVAEERLRISEQRYRRLIEASTDGILMVDPETCRVTDANPVMTQLLGCEREQVLGQALWQVGLFPDREATLELLRGLQERRVVRLETLPLQTRDGRRRYVDFVSIRFQANGHDLVQCNLRDVTEQRRLERWTQEALDALLEMACALVSPAGAGAGEWGRAGAGEAAEGPLHQLATLVRDVLDCAWVAIVAYDEATDVQQPLAAVGLTAEQEVHWRQALTGTRLAQYLERDRLAALHAGESFALDVTPLYRQGVSYGSVVALINPLRVGDHLVGTLSLDFGPMPHT